jgi:H+/Cl- antiporter ClcA
MKQYIQVLFLIPVLIAGMALAGWLAASIRKYAPEARGGEIPTAITILCGIVPFHWIKSLLSVFGSAMLTYFCGVPLGNEGPSVQMGTATIRLLCLLADVPFNLFHFFSHMLSFR